MYKIMITDTGTVSATGSIGAEDNAYGKDTPRDRVCCAKSESTSTHSQ